MVNYAPIPNLKTIGRRMSRTKHQRGSVELTGTRVKKWRGQFRVYVQQPDGLEKVRRRKVVLGLKSEMTKADARRRLAELIQREIGTAEVKQDDSVTFKWFWQNRFLPMYEKRWRPKTASELTYFFDGRILPLIGLTRLGDIHPFSAPEASQRPREGRGLEFCSAKVPNLGEGCSRRGG